MGEHAYRAFEIGEDGHVAGRIDFRNCPNDEAAKQWAKRLVDGRTIEVWSLSAAEFIECVATILKNQMQIPGHKFVPDGALL